MQKIILNTTSIEWIKIKKELIKYYSSLEPRHTIASSLGIKLKYSGYFAMIPENFDIDAHLTQYPLTNYMFVEDNTGRIKSVPTTGNLDSSLLFDKDRLIYIIGLISSIPAKNKDSITEDGYVVINSLLIRNAFKDYWSYLDYLIKTDVLCTDGQYILGEKSKGYKFTESYSDKPLKRYNYPISQAGVEAIPSEVYSEEDKTFLRNTVTDFPYLSYWYSVKKLSIDEVAASHYAYSVMQDKIRNGKESWDINRDKSHRNTIIRKDPKTQYHAAQYNIHSIAVGDYKASIDTNVHRLHSVITNLQKTYRKFLKFNGNQLINIDVSNSQPYLLCLLLNPLFWDKDSDIPLNISMLHQNVQDKFEECQLERIKTYVSSLDRTHKNLVGYINTVSIGQIYEYMANVINEARRTNFQKKDIKVMILTTLFSKNRYMPTCKRYFRMYFPDIYRLIELVKEIDYTALACLLQNIESEIILHRCCKRIWEKGNGKIPVFTIHDSICTTKGNENYVKDIMQSILRKNIGIPPFIKEETM